MVRSSATLVNVTGALAALIEDDEVMGAAVVAAMVIKPHDDEPGCLVLSGVQEGKVLLDFRKGRHAEEAGAVADLQEVLKCLSG